MHRIRNWVLVLIFMTSMIVPFTIYAQDTCPDSLPTRLIVGDYARVLPGSANNVRDTPSTSGAKVGEIPGEGVFEVLEGPVCAEGYTWYRVQYEDVNGSALIGWTVETFGDDYAVELYSLGMGSTVGYPRITLNIPAELSEPELTLSPTELYANGPWYGNAPEWIRLDFPGTGVMIEIYPREGFQRVFDTRGMNSSGTADLLASDRAASELTKEELSPLRIPTGTDLFAQVAYVDFEGGRGLRYIGFFSQDTTPVFPDQLTYVFQGYTDEYYIQGFVTQLSTEVIEEGIEGDVTNNYQAAYEAHITDRTAALNAAQSTDFSIDLAVLDALFASMSLEAGQPEPELVLNRIETATDVADPTPTIEVGDCGLVSRLEVGGLARQALGQDSLRVRDAAAGTATGENAFPGDIMNVQDGPVCAEGRNWWQVRKTDGAWTGWIAEAGDTGYFLEPIQPTATPTLTPTPTLTVTPSPTVPTPTPTVTNTPLPTRTPIPTNTPGPSPTPTNTNTPTLTPTLIAGRCRIIAIADSRLREYPDGTSVDNGYYAPANVALYVDAQFNRPGEGFTWWRLEPRSPIRPITRGGGFSSPRYNWVREDFVREEGDCESVREITP